MPEPLGVTLRRRREAVGVDLARIAVLTAIPEDYLRALESGATHRLPPGPYAQGFAKSYERALERLESGAAGPSPSTFGSDGFAERGTMPTADGDDAGPPTEAIVVRSQLPSARGRSGVPVGVLRAVALGLVGVFAVLVVFELGGAARAWWSRPTEAAPVDVRVELRGNALLRVRVDGRLEAHRVFAGGEVVGFHGRERVEVDVPDLVSSRFFFRGHPVLPQGHQDRPRRLVFVADGAAR